MVEAAVGLLQRYLRHDRQSQSENVMVPIRLVKRESVRNAKLGTTKQRSTP